MKFDFKKKFKLCLEEDLSTDLAQEIENSLDGAPEGPEGSASMDALEDSLDPGTEPSEYLTDPAADKALQRQIDQRNKEIASVIEGWVNKIEDFTEFLNGTSPSSLQSVLAKAQPGTLFAKVQASNSRKLANCAQELSSLAESLKSFLGVKAISQN